MKHGGRHGVAAWNELLHYDINGNHCIKAWTELLDCRIDGAIALHIE